MKKKKPKKIRRLAEKRIKNRNGQIKAELAQAKTNLYRMYLNSQEGFNNKKYD